MNHLKYYVRLAVLGVIVTAAAGSVHVSRSWSWSAAKHAPLSKSRGKLDQTALKSLGYRLKNAVIQTNPAGKASSSPVVNELAHRHSFLRNERNDTPVFMSGDAVSGLKRRMGKIAAGATAPDIALRFITANHAFFKLADPPDELVLRSVTTDGNGNQHVQYDQYYCGVPLRGNQLTVHLDRNSEPYAFNARYTPTPVGIDVRDVRFSDTKAIEKAETDLSSRTTIHDLNDFIRSLYKYDGPSADLVIMVNPYMHKPLLAWHVAIRPDARDYWQYFIDARNGSIVEKYNAAVSYNSVETTAVDALGTERVMYVTEEEDVYYMWDSEAGIYTYDAQGKIIDENGVPLISSPDNTWPDSIAVSAHTNTRMTLDYYALKHNRQGLDGEGGELPQVIHFTEDGKPMYNAFWGGGFIAFGDADIFAAALDVVAHELTHGVVEYTVGLEYKFQSGALNEGFADAIAAMVDPDWDIGEDLHTGPLRDMKNPERFGLPAHMDDYREMSLEQDNGGVHFNMSIPARVCVLTVETIGREKTARIWYRILNNRYLTPKSQFIDMRYAAVQSAVDLFGAESTEVTAVINAFDEVGIVEDEPTEPPEDMPPAEGEPMVAFVLENNLVLAGSLIESEKDIVLPVETEVFTEGSSPITVSIDGSFLLFIDSDNNLRFLDLETFEEELLDDAGDWSSIALSPDCTRLAATTIFEDRTIYILDLEIPENSKAISIYTASTEGVYTKTALFADALDWDRTGSYLLYDAFHRLPVFNGNPIEFWDVNLLDVDCEIITRVKTHTDYGIQVGNPSFAETNDRYIVCDLFYNELNFNVIVAIDLFNLKKNVLRDNGMIDNGYPNLGFPKYSPDDTSVIYQQYEPDSDTYVLSMLPLDNDKMSLAGDEEIYFEGSLPVWFVREKAEVAVNERKVPSAHVLYQNIPNPFNPFTTIPFAVSEPGHVTLTVYDLLGQKVETLVNGYYPAGTFSVPFDGGTVASGIYFYRLEIGDYSKNKKMLLVK